MIKYVQLLTIVLFGSTILFSCSDQKKEDLPIENTISDAQFTPLSSMETGIKFINRLEENTYMNGFMYEYYYNGSGVAVADFNNDGIMDIYFVSTLSANELYLNKGKMKFVEVGALSKTQGSIGLATGVTVVDINADGLMDIYVCKSGAFKKEDPLKNELLINQGVGKDGIPVFKENAKQYGLDLLHNSVQASFFDYDRDGDLDLFLINHGLNQSYSDAVIPKLVQLKNTRAGEKLYRNDNSTFVEVTHKAGIIGNALGYTLGVAISDVNNDTWPDIYTGNDYAEKDHLYLNNQDGTFREVSLQTFGHVSNFSMGNDIADINNDGLMDIISLDMMANDNYTQKTSMSGMDREKFWGYVDMGLHRQYMFNALQLNSGIEPNSGLPMFSDIAQLAGVSNTDWSWSPLIFDMDNDGFKDLFVSNGIKRDGRNNDFNIFHKNKRQEIRGIGFLDKDKYIKELLEKIPPRKKQNYFFKNQKNLTFKKLNFKDSTTSSNGAAYADFDNDGDLDLVVNNSDDIAKIYQNNASKENHYIKIELKGPAKNKSAIGTKIEVITKNGIQVAEQYFARGFQSAMSGPLHFGLGREKSIDTLKVLWPDGTEQYHLAVKSNQCYKVVYNPQKSKLSNNFDTQPQFVFKDITSDTSIDFIHKENEYDDFEVESLLPHKMSQLGPALAVADVNNDGLEDFYVGGACGQSGRLYIQTTGGDFKLKTTSVFEADSWHEDTGALFLDADKDGDMDLYVVSGGNEKEPNNVFYKDRFYENDGQGSFSKANNAIPKITTSGLKVVAGDYDADGDLDLFIGSRIMPMNYGKPSKSYLLENQSTEGKVKFLDVTETVLPELTEYGMVTDALWEDMDGDNRVDLVIASEWGHIDLFKNTKNGFENRSSLLGLDSQTGWWYALKAMDIDHDGDKDLVAGNLGLNYKYKASKEAPFYMYINDFDDNNDTDIVLGYHEGEEVYPLRGRQCTSNQMPFVKKKFATYDAFAKADLEQVYGQKLNSSLKYIATNFATCVVENVNNEKFRFKPLPNEVQVSSVNEILYKDFDNDGFEDLLLFGNLYGSEVETPRNDASYGHFLKGNGDGSFKSISSNQSGLFITGEVRKVSLINKGPANNRKTIVLARNDLPLTFIEAEITQNLDNNSTD